MEQLGSHWTEFHEILYLKIFRKSVKKIQVKTACGWKPLSSPQGTTRLPLDGYSWSFVFENFSKNPTRKYKLHHNLTTITATLHTDRYTFLIISRTVLLTMRNVSDKSCTENQNTHFVFSNVFFLKSRRL